MSIKELRERRGLTQAQVADKLNVDRSAVTKWETGDSTPLLAMVIATAAAAAGFIALLVARRRKNRLEEENDPQLEPREDWEDRHE